MIRAIKGYLYKLHRRIRKEAVFTAIVGIIVPATLVFWEWNIFKEQEWEIFLFEAEQMKEVLFESVNAGEAIAQSMRAFFHSSAYVDADEFRIFAGELFSHYGFITSIAYASRVSIETRLAFEQEQRDWGFATFEIFEYNDRQERLRAPTRSAYFPIIYHEPFSPDFAATIGYDMYSTAKASHAINQAILTGCPAVMVASEQEEYKLFIATYEGKRLPATPQERRQKVNGLLSLSLSPQAIFHAVEFPPALSLRLNFVVHDPTLSAALLFQHVPEATNEWGKLRISTLSVAYDIPLADQQLQLLISKELSLREIRSWVIFMTCVLSVLVDSGLILIVRARVSLEQELATRKRTEKALQQLNQKLDQRVADRTAELQHTLESLQQTQEQLIQTEKMAALGRLVAGVAHEINTPIGIGITASSLLEMKTKEMQTLYAGGQLKQSDFEKFIQVSIETSHILSSNLTRAGQLIQSFKKVSVDQIADLQRAFNLSEYIQEVLLSLKPQFKNTPHSVTVHCPETLIIESYPGAFSQILTNLLMNSITHGFDGMQQGTIDIRVTTTERALTLRYHDNGNGIAKGNLSKIFEPFYTTKRGHGGTGLGMSIVYNLVTQRLRGTISCESDVNQGVTFVIQLPLHP